MKIITCTSCGSKIRIPDDKHIRFKCPNTACGYQYEYKNGEPFREQRSYWVPLAAILFAIVGSFFTYLFPIPLLTGAAGFLWWLYKPSKKILKKAAAGFLAATTIGLLLLFVLQLLLNVAVTPHSTEIPRWLLQLDDFLIWARLKLSVISAISLIGYLGILAVLLYLSLKKPEWKLVSKFTTLEGWVGKTAAILVVITSFTFASPYILDQAAGRGYYKHFRITYREKLKQERKMLIADGIRSVIESDDTTDYAASLADLKQDIEIAMSDTITMRTAAQYDAKAIVNSYREYNSYASQPFNSYKGTEGSDKELRNKWQKKKKDFQKEAKQEWRSSRQKFSKSIVAGVKEAEIKAGEAVSAIKAVLAKVLGIIVPGGDNLAGKYIEEVIDAVADYVIDKNNITEVVKAFFRYIPERTSGLFARIGRFREKITNMRMERQKEAEMKLQEEADRKKREALEALEKENESLADKLEKKIRKLDAPIPDGWEDIKESLEANEGRSFTDQELKQRIKAKARDDLVELLINQDVNSAPAIRNDNLKNNWEAVKNARNTNDVLEKLKDVFSYSICPFCHMPAIPGTPCIVRF